MKSLQSWLASCPLVGILRGVTPDEVTGIAGALVGAGFRIIEVSLNSPQPIESIRRLAQGVGDDVLIGAGTVLDANTVPDIAAAGGRLVVTPHASPSVVRAAKSVGLITIPGFVTPTEAFSMLDAGADGLKLFPAEANPPTVLKAMKAVLPADVPVLPVGSITPDKIAGYLAAGAAGFGLGSALYKPAMPAETVATNAQGFMTALAL